MATYNGSQYILPQLHSLASQSYLPAELIVTDDASTDDTVDIIRSFAVTAPFHIVVERNPTRLGWRRNFMKAGSLCQFELIAFCDQDDIWHWRKLETCARFFSDDGLLLVHHNAELFGENADIGDTVVSPSRAAEVLAPLATSPLWENPLGFTMVFRRELAQFADVWENSIDKTDVSQFAAHDQWIYFLASSLGATRYIPDCLAGYRQHASNAVGWQSKHQDPGVARVDRRRQALDLLWQIAVNRQTLLRSVASKPGIDPNSITLAIECNTVQVNRLTMIKAMHAAPTLGSRLQLYLALLWSGAYMPYVKWTIGLRAMLEDVIVVLSA